MENNKSRRKHQRGKHFSKMQIYNFADFTFLMRVVHEKWYKVDAKCKRNLRNE